MKQYSTDQMDPMAGTLVPVLPLQTINPPIPSNQMGTAKPVFNDQAMSNGNNLFGANPQQGLANPPMFQTEYSKYNNQQLT